MDSPKAVAATFSDDADGGGLTNTEEAALGSNPWKADTDDDGFDDAFEIAHGLSPTNDNSAIASYVEAAKPNGFVSIAVATGGFDFQALEKAGADYVFEDFSDSRRLLEVLGAA